MGNLMLLEQEITDLNTLIDGLASESDGEIPADVLARFVGAQLAVKEKITNMVGYIRHLETLEAGAAEFVKAVQERKKAFTNRRERIREAIGSWMSVTGTKRLETGIATITALKPRTKIKINEAEVSQSLKTLTATALSVDVTTATFQQIMALDGQARMVAVDGVNVMLSFRLVASPERMAVLVEAGTIPVGVTVSTVQGIMIK